MRKRKTKQPGEKSVWKKRLKKPLLVLLALLVLSGAAVGGVYAYQSYQQENRQAEVIYVSNLNWGYAEDAMSSAGTVTSDYTQSIYTEDKTVAEVKVEEGAEVKAGDPLLVYDTAETQLQVKMKRLELRGIKNDIKIARRELERLNKIKPVSNSSNSSSESTKTATSGSADNAKTTTTTSGSPDSTKTTTTTASAGKLETASSSGVSALGDALWTETDRGSDGDVILEEDSQGNLKSSVSAKGTASDGSSTIVVQVQKKDGDAYNYIDADAKPYTGTGTVEDPYRFLCTRECYVLGSYLNQLIKNEQVAAFEIWNGNSTEEGTLVSCWTYNGAEKTAVPDNSKWLVSTQQQINDAIIIDADDDEDDEENSSSNNSSTNSSSGSNSGSSNSSSSSGTSGKTDSDADDDDDDAEEEYTASELREAKAEKESELKDLDIDRRTVKLELQKLKRTIEQATVTSAINGVVKTVGDPENPPTDGSAFMEISGSSGLYVTGEIGELMLDKIEVGQLITVNSWNNGQTYSAEITEISDYPSDDNGGYYGSGNPNVSYYSFTAYIEESEGLTNGDYVDLSMTPASSEEEMDSIYIEKAYVREENGRYYVLKADEEDKLVKQYVQTGKTLYGSAIEIKEGLTVDDRIAFPYGKTAKEGVRAVESLDY